MRFGRHICGDLVQAERREWWLSNGLGAYAAGTLAGTLTRRYHGLLIAPVGDYLDRYLLLSKADAHLLLDGIDYPLFSNRWRDGVSPDGLKHIESFELDGRMPVWRYAFGDARLETRIWMDPGCNRTWVAYRYAGDRPARLCADLLVNARSHHGEMQVGGFSPSIQAEAGGLRLSVSDLFDLNVACHGGEISARNVWYEGFRLREEQLRHLNSVDNHLCTAGLSFDLEPGVWVGFSAAIGEQKTIGLKKSMQGFHRCEQGLVEQAEQSNPWLRGPPAWIRQLILAADSFVISRRLPGMADGRSIIAGYPWFGDWGRDSMIALPGLTLTCGREEVARKILQTYAGVVDQGMLPNRFVGQGEQAEYNTVDAALWFFVAWHAYHEATGDKDAVQQVFPVLCDMLDWHIKGTRYGIRMDEQDALLHAGEPGVQLTWMDAKVGDWVVTPRIGKPVEINALWYNALSILAGFAELLGGDGKRYRDLALRVEDAFDRFQRPQGGLYDVLDGPQGDDAAMRPNQIFAVSLPFSPLPSEMQAAVVRECAEELLTSYGLRSLSPSDPAYVPRYAGGVSKRDGAYHQGSVWGWLLGHYAWAEYRVTGDAALAQSRLQPLSDHLNDAGLGTLSEIFDAEAPHEPRGAPAQAWSVACTLEAWLKLEQTK